MHVPRPVTALAAAGLAVTTLSVTAPAAVSRSTGPYLLSQIKVLNGTGTEVMRWDPCGPAIRFRVNVRAVPGLRAKRRAIREVRASVRDLAGASGLRFAYAGTTREVPRSTTVRRQRTPLVVAFVRPGQTDYPLAGRTAGYGGVWGRYMLTGLQHFRVTRGWVVIDQPQTRHMRKSLTARGVTRPNLIRHELGHAVGLEHVSDAKQLMYPTLHARGPHSYASGDRAGLRKLGPAAGCIG
jgi:hypothetical protein